MMDKQQREQHIKVLAEALETIERTGDVKQLAELRHTVGKVMGEIVHVQRCWLEEMQECHALKREVERLKRYIPPVQFSLF